MNQKIVNTLEQPNMEEAGASREDLRQLSPEDTETHKEELVLSSKRTY